MLARNKRIPSYHELKPTSVLELRMQQLLSVSNSVVTEFIVADWLLLLECVYKKVSGCSRYTNFGYWAQSSRFSTFGF